MQGNGQAEVHVERALLHLYIGKRHHIISLPDLEERVHMVAAEFGESAVAVAQMAFTELKAADIGASPLELTADHLRGILAPIFIAVEQAARNSN
jgi:hypothetical protein